MSKAAAEAPREKVLLVDDNPTNLQVLLRTLETQPCELLIAKSGEAALEVARKSRPSLILLDIMMPGIDGFETCRRLKGDALTQDSAVIFLSAMGEVQDKVKGLELGAVDYITKPFQGEEVIARVNTHLTIRRLRREVQARWEDLDRELKVVADAQKALLPEKLPQIEGLRLAAYYATSRYAGGDYYDVVPLPDQQWGILMADAAGHGVPAAVLMAMTHAVFHAIPEPRVAPGEVLNYLNRHMTNFRWPRFVTALYAVFNCRDRTLRVSNAGHNPPLHYRAETGEVAQLVHDSVFPLGVAEFGDVPTASDRLAPGDRLLFYTDGITERFAPGGELYGVERLLERFRLCPARSPDAAVEWLMSDVDGFAGARPADDDQTLLVGFVG